MERSTFGSPDKKKVNIWHQKAWTNFNVDTIKIKWFTEPSYFQVWQKQVFILIESLWEHLRPSHLLSAEKAMAPHSSTLAWKIPWMEEPGRLQSMGSLRVGHDWVTSLSLFTFMHGEGNGNPLQYSCLENPRDRGAWWAAVYGVAQSRTQLKRLSSSSTYSLRSQVSL